MCEDAESDPLLEELGEVRQRIRDECDRDLDKYFAHLMEFEEQLRREGWKLVECEPRQDTSGEMEESWAPDPLLDEVDEARRRILEEHGNDRRKVLEYSIEQEKHYADRMIDPPTSSRKGKPAA